MGMPFAPCFLTIRSYFRSALVIPIQPTVPHVPASKRTHSPWKEMANRTQFGFLRRLERSHGMRAIRPKWKCHSTNRTQFGSQIVRLYNANCPKLNLENLVIFCRSQSFSPKEPKFHMSKDRDLTASQFRIRQFEIRTVAGIQ